MFIVSPRTGPSAPVVESPVRITGVVPFARIGPIGPLLPSVLYLLVKVVEVVEVVPVFLVVVVVGAGVAALAKFANAVCISKVRANTKENLRAKLRIALFFLFIAWGPIRRWPTSMTKATV